MSPGGSSWTFSMSHGATLLGHAPECLRARVLTPRGNTGCCAAWNAFPRRPGRTALPGGPVCRAGPLHRFGIRSHPARLRLCPGCQRSRQDHSLLRSLSPVTTSSPTSAATPPPTSLGAQPPYRESAGIPESMAELIIPVEYNNLEALEAVVAAHAGEAGTLLVEPVDYNCGCITPAPGFFLEATRALADKHDLVLFFDEVQSFAKASPGGPQTGLRCDAGHLHDRQVPRGRPAALGHRRPGRPDGSLRPPPVLSPTRAPSTPRCRQFSVAWPSSTNPEARFLEDDWRTGRGAVCRAQRTSPAAAGCRSFSAPRQPLRDHLRHPDPVTNYSQALVHDPETMLEFSRANNQPGCLLPRLRWGPCHHGYSWPIRSRTSTRPCKRSTIRCRQWGDPGEPNGLVFAPNLLH
ncbi:MAG: hypothetical protein Ct9H300mP1_12330 [Planctomycetaceae bacterium]|nr:MAG: hypothetical protein Ct9H300mP1_12330 [Planctomycetaceae bacterium]